ncbi:MAG: molybdopterin-dependent oxidoreductase, partial [Gammaproteobacteria bacterium]|nr:molybdopterin-dependent oxidoreductase [Gammaproteobacteria bacterium]
QCGLAQNVVEKFYRLFARTERVVTLYSQGINQWSYGTDRVNSIINCHLYTGRIGRAGMGPFSITGQPNAMGGREVGGLANQLAAHMAIENPAHRKLVKTFWNASTIAEHEGLKAVDMFDAMDKGKIKAVWIMATNPAVSMPDANKVKRALGKCDFVVVSDCMQYTDTTRYADVLLPATTWGERDGTVTNSERRISRQREFLSPAGISKPDWWIISEVAKRMGYTEQFNYSDAVEIFNEHAALSAYKNNNGNQNRDFNISALENLSVAEYNNLKPVQWPVTQDAINGTARLFADGKFYTANGRAKFIAVVNSTAAHNLSASYPLRLNTGRIRDQWHTMTRTGKAARLSGHIYEPFVQVHPDDAANFSLTDNQLAQVASELGNIICRVNVTETQQQGNVFVPIHWNDQFASKAVVDSLVNASVDPVSGQPEFKATPVNIKPYQPKWYGFLISRRKLNIEQANYWSCSKGNNLWRYEIAGDQVPADWAEYARGLLCQHADAIAWTEYFDTAVNRYRAARIENKRLESCIFIGPDFSLPERDWLLKLFSEDQLNDADRTGILSGKPMSGEKDAGKTVCACFNVGVNTIVDAIKTQHLNTPEQVGKKLRAGTNCGSCQPEIKELIKVHFKA